MIRLTCSACRTTLEVDDAFAGGVCRCSHCGTIQTVPKLDTTPVDPDAPTTPDADTPAPAGKTLLRQQGRAVVGSGLDELAQVVASSGLRSSRLRSSRPPSDLPRPTSPSRSRPIWLLPVLICAALFILLGILFLLLKHRPPTAAPITGVQVTSPTTPPATPANPQLLDPIPLSTPKSVVFLIDRGGSSSEVFSYSRELALRAAASLGPTREFAILFWANGTPEASYPRSDKLAFASPESIAAARKTLDDLTAFGQSDITKPLRSALALKPDAIIILTAKGFDLDDAWADSVLSERNAMSPNTTLHTLSIGTTGTSPGLKKIAEKTNGTYTELSPADLRSRVNE